MKEDDLKAVTDCLDLWKDDLGKVEKICLLSPSQEERVLVRALFTKASIKEIGITTCDLNSEKSLGEKFDLVIACNVFMCSQDVKSWIACIMSSARVLVIQDLIRAWRNNREELSAETGDINRFCYLPDESARVQNAFDLKQLNDSLKHVYFWDGDNAVAYDGTVMDSRKFVCMIEAVNETPVETPVWTKKKKS